MVDNPEERSSATRATMSSATSDHSLLERFRHGSESAATQLYLRYAQRLRGLTRAQLSPALARRVEVDDLVQSVFGSFFRRARNGYYDVPEGEELWSLFLVIALNKIRNQGAYHHAGKRDVRRVADGMDLDQLDGGKAAAEGADYAFLELVIEEALGRLTDDHRRAIELRIQGHEVADIAQQLACSKRTVERLLQEARKRLGELLCEDHGT